MNEDLSHLLPEGYEGLFFQNGTLLSENANGFFALILNICQEVIAKEGGSAVRLFALVAICGLFSSFEEISHKKTTGTALQFCLLLSGLFTLLPSVQQAFSESKLHLEELSAYVTAILPTLSGVLLSMGAVNSFSLSTVSLSLILSFLSQFVLGMLFPFLKLSLTFDLFSAITANKGLSSFAGTVKKLYLWLMGLCTTVILTVFAFQNVIASKADSLSLRAFRFTAAGMVPMVGQTIAESSKTLLSGLEMMRASVGVIGVGVMLLMLLPQLFTLLIRKLVFDTAASMADACGCTILSSIFRTGSSVFGGLAALIALSDLLFTVSFSLLSFFTIS